MKINKLSNIRLFLILTLLLLNSTFLSAQYINPNFLSAEQKRAIKSTQTSINSSPQQDCNSAIPVCSNTFTEINSYSGSGNINDIPANGSCLGSNETNSVWYIFTVTQSGDLTFTINPNSNADYDFAIYNLTNKNCQDINNGSLSPVRCSYYPPGLLFPSYNTGLDATSTDDTESGGLFSGDDGWLRKLTVTVGETYVLVLDNFSGNATGFNLTFGGSAQIFDNTPPTIVKASVPCSGTTITVDVSENIKCSSIAADGSDFQITGSGGPYTISAVTGVNCGSFTNKVTFNVSPALSGTGPWNLVLKNGSDNNTLIDNCNAISVGATIAITTTAPFTIGTPVVVNNTCGANPAVGSITVTVTGASSPTYVWKDSLTGTTLASTTNTLTALDAGTYQLTVTDNGCSKTIYIHVKTPTPFIVGTPVVVDNICGSSPAIGSINVPINGATSPTYVWKDSLTGALLTSTSNSITGLTGSTYQLKITDGGCSSTIYVHVKNTGQPNVNITPTVINSCNLTSITITSNTAGDWTSKPAGFTQTNTSSVTINPLPSVNTMYYVTVTAGGCTGIDSVDLKIGAPSFSINNPIVVNNTCGSNPATGSIQVSLTGNTGTATLVLKDSLTGAQISTGTITGTNALTFTTLTGKTYLVSVTANGCTLDKYIVVKTVGAPIINLNQSDQSICNGDSILVSSSGATTYSWTPTAGVNSVTATSTYLKPSTTTTYTVTGTTNGCTGTKSITLTVNSKPTVTTNPANGSLCIGDSVQITLGGATSYSWQPTAGVTQPSTTISYLKPNTTTIYVVTGTDVNGCKDTVNVTTTVNPKPTAIASNDSPVCIGSIVNFQANGGNTYVWSGPNFIVNTSTLQNPIINFLSLSDTGTYTVVVTDRNGCIDSTSTVVSINPQPIVGYSYSTACAGKPVTFTDTTQGIITQQLWDFDYPNAQTSSTAIASYTYPLGVLCHDVYHKVITDKGCADSSITNICLTPKPVADFDVDTTKGCTPLCISFTNKSTDALNYNWSLDDGQYSILTDASACYEDKGKYTIRLIAQNQNCFDTLTKNNFITVYQTPVANFDVDPRTVNLINSEVNIINTSLFANEYSWTFSDTNATIITNSMDQFQHSYNKVGEFTITEVAKSIEGCTDTTKQKVEVKPSWAIYIPNSFTPNKDGINDLFNAQAFNIKDYGYELVIISRWGDKITTINSLSSTAGWDGAEYPIGTYMYELTYKDPNGRDHYSSGVVTLVR